MDSDADTAVVATTDHEPLIEGLLPEPSTEGRRGKHPRREVVNAVLYVVRSGCPWRYLPADLSPWQTVYWYFALGRRRGDRAAPGDAAGQGPGAGRPQAAAVGGDHPLAVVKGADTVGTDTRGYDAGRRVNGRKRFIVTDTAGPLITVAVMAASRQDRDGAKAALLSSYLATPVRHVFADQGFAGRLVDWARGTLTTTLEIVREPVDQQGFAVHSADGWSSRPWPG
jgi:hypothetical protein